MSSFICSAKHFNSIERALIKLTNGEGGGKQIRVFMDTMRDLSVLCVTLQYARYYKGKLDEEIAAQREFVKEKTEIQRLSLPQLVGAMKCMRYQIEIEYLTELRPLTELENRCMGFMNDTIEEFEAITKDMAVKTDEIWSID